MILFLISFIILILFLDEIWLIWSINISIIFVLPFLILFVRCVIRYFSYSALLNRLFFWSTNCIYFVIFHQHFHCATWFEFFCISTLNIILNLFTLSSILIVLLIPLFSHFGSFLFFHALSTTLFNLLYLWSFIISFSIRTLFFFKQLSLLWLTIWYFLPTCCVFWSLS